MKGVTITDLVIDEFSRTDKSELNATTFIEVKHKKTDKQDTAIIFTSHLFIITLLL
jgi:hypothetical protein